MWRIKTLEELKSEGLVTTVRTSSGVSLNSIGRPDGQESMSSFMKDKLLGFDISKIRTTSHVFLKKRLTSRFEEVNTYTDNAGIEELVVEFSSEDGHNNVPYFISRFLSGTHGFDEFRTIAFHAYKKSLLPDFTGRDTTIIYLARWMVTELFSCVFDSRYGVKKGSVVMIPDEKFGRVVESVQHNKQKKYQVITECGGIFPIHNVKLVNTKRIKDIL